MTRYLVVAHKTLVGPDLLALVEDTVRSGPCEFHLVVPAVHPSGHPWTEGEVQAAAEARLAEGLERFEEIGATVTGQAGDVNPVNAVEDAIRDNRYAGKPPFDRIIVSTLPHGPSRWLHLDVVSRIRKQVRLPVVHVEAAPARV
jgi:GABA permease